MYTYIYIYIYIEPCHKKMYYIYISYHRTISDLYTPSQPQKPPPKVVVISPKQGDVERQATWQNG